MKPVARQACCWLNNWVKCVCVLLQLWLGAVCCAGYLCGRKDLSEPINLPLLLTFLETSWLLSLEHLKLLNFIQSQWQTQDPTSKGFPSLH